MNSLTFLCPFLQVLETILVIVICAVGLTANLQVSVEVALDKFAITSLPALSFYLYLIDLDILVLTRVICAFHYSLK